MQLRDLISQDVRPAARALTRARALTATAVLTLAIGIGAVTTMFTIVNAVAVRPLPFDRPDELYDVRKTDAAGTSVWVSLPELNDWRSRNRSFAALAGSTAFDFTLRGTPPVVISATGVTPGYLETLGARVHVGRGFSATEFEPGSDRVVLLTYQFWQQRFSADPAAIGTLLELEGPFHLPDSRGPYTIVGVLTPEFWHFYDRARTHIVLPLRASAEAMADRERRMVERVIARLAATERSAAAQELERISATPDGESARPSARASIEVSPLAAVHFGPVRQSALLLLGATALVALIASVNVSVLFLVRAQDSRHEMAVRMGLGANRAGLIRLRLAEAGIVSLAGGAVGAIASFWSLGLVTRVLPGGMLTRIPGGADGIAIDSTTVLVTAAVTAAVALCTAAAPAWLAWRSSDRSGRAGLRRQEASHGDRAQRLLIVSEVALAVVLLGGTAFLLNSLVWMHRVDLGLIPPPGIVAWVNLNSSQYPTDEHKTRFYDSLLEQLDAQPAVRRVSAIDLPFTFEWQTIGFDVEGGMPPVDEQSPQALDRAVSPEYFVHHGIDLRRGRQFDARDTAASPAVAIVSETFARRLWPARDPVGRRLMLAGQRPGSTEVTVVGVVSDVRPAPHADARPTVYRPYAQHPPPWIYVTVEGQDDAAVLMEALREATAAVDLLQPVEGPWTLAEWIRDTTSQARLLTSLGGLFAAYALLLAAVGIYGVLTHIVSRRTREFGIRIALGATSLRILWTACSRGLGMAATGIALGLTGTLALSRSMATMLFGVSPGDPATLAAAATVFAAVSMLACIIPARRAARVDPAVTLRE